MPIIIIKKCRQGTVSSAKDYDIWDHKFLFLSHSNYYRLHRSNNNLYISFSLYRGVLLPTGFFLTVLDDPHWLDQLESGSNKRGQARILLLQTFPLLISIREMKAFMGLRIFMEYCVIKKSQLISAIFPFFLSIYYVYENCSHSIIWIFSLCKDNLFLYVIFYFYQVEKDGFDFFFLFFLGKKNIIGLFSLCLSFLPLFTYLL